MKREIRRGTFALLLGVLALLTGCARFTNPAVNESGPALDAGLVGQWELRSKDGTVEVDIRRNGADGLITIRSDESGTTKTERARLVTARIGQINLVSAQTLEGADRGSWSIFRYDLDGDRLVVTPGDDAYWQKTVEDGRLDGRVEKKQLAMFITITASEAQLRTVLLGYGNVIFATDPTPEIVLERVRE